MSNLKNLVIEEVFFHEEAHIYFNNQKDLDAFTKSYNKNSDWAVNNKDRWNAVPSVTQIIGKLYLFDNSLRITKAWYKKTMLKLGYEASKDFGEHTELIIETLEEIEATLKYDLEKSQDWGIFVHMCVQQYWDHLGVAPTIHYNFPEVTKIFKDITYVAKAEIPAIYKTRNGTPLFAGKWDGLLEMTINGESKIILVDIKTGSPLKYDKKKKVGIQLDMYRAIIEQQNKDIKIDEMWCLELATTYNKETGEPSYYTKLHKFESHWDKVSKIIYNLNDTTKLLKEIK